MCLATAKNSHANCMQFVPNIACAVLDGVLLNVKHGEKRDAWLLEPIVGSDSYYICPPGIRDRGLTPWLTANAKTSISR